MKTKFALNYSSAAAGLFALSALPCVLGAWFIIPAFAAFLPVEFGVFWRVEFGLGLVVLQSIAAAIIAMLFARAIWQHAFLRGQLAVRAVAFLPKEVMEITTNNDLHYGELLTARISPFLSVFVVKIQNKRIAVLVFFDSIVGENTRRFRMLLHLRRRKMNAKKYAEEEAEKEVKTDADPALPGINRYSIFLDK